MTVDQGASGARFLVLVFVLALIAPAITAQCPPIAASAKQQPTSSPQFFDEPAFTVAGVTDTTSLGGHASANSVPSQTIARQVTSLKEAPHSPSTPATEKSLRESVERNPASFEANYQLGKFLTSSGKHAAAVTYLERASQLRPENADVHHLLGDCNEKLGNPLEAVKQYQRAAELQPSESNLFDWGAELLAHGAVEPATQVFSKGKRLFPQSSRMLIALGAASYARGSYGQAGQYLCEATDLNPRNPGAYGLLDKLQVADGGQSDAIIQRMARYVQLDPANGLANYYYAAALRNRPAGAESSLQVETLLRNAVRLDPQLALAHVQLGILYAERKDFREAIAAYQKAIQADPRSDVAHYRLAQAYRAIGEKSSADKETEIYKQLVSEKTSDKERQAIQQFVYTLRRNDPAR